MGRHVPGRFSGRPCASPSALPPLPLVLRRGVGTSLPLHIRRCIGAAAGQGLHMVDHIARAGPAPVAVGGAGVFVLELLPRARVAVDLRLAGEWEGEQQAEEGGGPHGVAGLELR
jgi:hypothetical protein